MLLPILIQAILFEELSKEESIIVSEIERAIRQDFCIRI